MNHIFFQILKLIYYKLMELVINIDGIGQNYLNSILSSSIPTTDLNSFIFIS
jgi:hypothetical protein